MEELIFPYKLYKIRLVKTERDIFGGPISSNDWDKIVKLLYEDVKQEVFHFVHPKNKGIVYQRNYADCPVNGNAILTIGRLRDTTDYAIVSIITKSHMYHEPYLALEEIEPAFPNPKILLEIVRRGFNSALKQFGLEVELKLWEGDETSHWRDDRWASYILELKKSPEIAKKNIGFQQAIECVSKVKEADEKKEEKKRNRKEARAKTEDNKFDILNYMSSKVKNKPKLLDWLDEKVKGQNVPIGMMRPVRFLMNKKLMKGLTISAFNKRYHKEGLISVSSFNNYTNEQYVCFVNDPIYDDLEEHFEIDRFI